MDRPEGGKKRSFSLSFKLEAIKFAEQHSGEAAARQFDVDPSLIRQWKKKKSVFEELVTTPMGDQQRPTTQKRLKGGGRKPREELDAAVFRWIAEQRSKSLRVSRRMIREEAKKIFPGLASDGRNFTASVGWLDKFLKRQGLSARKSTSADQKDPVQLFEELVEFMVYVSSKGKESDISQCDELPQVAATEKNESVTEAKEIVIFENDEERHPVASSESSRESECSTDSESNITL